MANGCRKELKEYSIRACKLPTLVLRDSADRFSWNRMISYPNYKFYWPIKALGLFARRYENPTIF